MVLFFSTSFLGNYIGGVINSTKQGFNITDINFLADKNQEDVSRIEELADNEKPLWFSKYEDMQQLKLLLILREQNEL